MRYLINGNMKAIRCGQFAKADKEASEFIYDSIAPNDDTHNVAVMRGIADAHGFVIPDNLNKRVDIASRLAEQLKKLKLPEVKSMTDTEKVTGIIVAGVEADKTDDQILVDIVNAGISFKNAGKMFKKIMEEKGLRINSKTRQEQVFKILKKARFKPKEYSQVETMLAVVRKEVTDTSEKQALSLVKKYAKEGELTLPKAPKTAGGKGKAKINAFMIENPTAKKAEFKKFMLELGKKEKVIDRNWEIFEVAQKMAQTLANPPAADEETKSA